MSVGYIYGLRHPITKEVKYIGKTTGKLNRRLSAHVQEARTLRRNAKVHIWIKSLMNKNIRPEIYLIDKAPIIYINSLEIYYIKKFKELGIDLKNEQPGGEGQPKGYQIKNRHKPPKGVMPAGFLNSKKYWLPKGHVRPKEWENKSKRTRLERKSGYKPIIATKISTNEFLFFDSLKEAARVLKLHSPNITAALNIKNKNGTRRQTGGYYFQYQ